MDSHKICKFFGVDHQDYTWGGTFATFLSNSTLYMEPLGEAHYVSIWIMVDKEDRNE